jgi:hypothetical protein
MYCLGMDLIFELRDAEKGGYCARLLAVDLMTNGSGSSRRLAARSKCGSGGCRWRRARFPEKVTAFREGMAVHGRYGEPCGRCGAKVLRIRYADNETNYCAKCQTGGRVHADRGLSRLLGADWPRTLDELEELRRH